MLEGESDEVFESGGVLTKGLYTPHRKRRLPQAEECWPLCPASLNRHSSYEEEVGLHLTLYPVQYSKAPENMRGLVMGVNLMQNAFSAAIGQALVPLAEDPLLIWNYAVVAILAFVGTYHD